MRLDLDIFTISINMKNENPLVSIIIVNWNGIQWLKSCLKSLENQTYKNYEIIFIDNNSEDSSLQYVFSCCPSAKIIKNNKNDGFALGNNIGLNYISGEFVLLLNNDTDAHSTMVEELVQPLLDNSNIGTVQAKLVLMDDENIIDSCGSYLTLTTFLYHVGYGKRADLNIYNKSRPVFSNKGACMMIRREIINSIGLFDEQYWCYYEETDFCHRVWLAGWECWYWPKAICKHGLGGTSKKIMGEFIIYHNFKNKLNSHLKNFEIKNLLWILPLHFLLSTIYALILLRSSKSRSLAIVKGYYWNFTNIKDTIKKRKEVQRNRKINDRELFKRCMLNPQLKYYKYLFMGKLSDYNDVL